MVDYVTRDEFNELEARVTVLEGGQPPVAPPNPIANGIQAKRIASLIGLFGVNTFSSLDEHNLWGSWPADYRPDSVIAALRYILGDSGHAFRIREYHYAGREEMQRDWLSQIVTAIPGTEVTLCVGANGKVEDVPSMISLAADPECGVKWIEGLNEPNTKFTDAPIVPFNVTYDIQDAIYIDQEQASVMAMGPSIVAGMPHPEGWITGYCGNQDNLDALNSKFDHGNGHYYPPGHPDAPNTGYSVNEYIGGLWGVYAQKPIHLTEFHPTLYNNEGHKPDQDGWDGGRDAYYTLITLLRCAENGTIGLWWYALFDYGTGYLCGLFPKDHANDPRPVADALKNLCSICHDRGDKNSFDPGKLDITVVGSANSDVYHASDGRFLVPLWNSSNGELEVTVSFDTQKKLIKIYDVLESNIATETRNNVSSITLAIAPGVVVLEIVP
jgi:hypothetical protein